MIELCWRLPGASAVATCVGDPEIAAVYISTAHELHREPFLTASKTGRLLPDAGAGRGARSDRGDGGVQSLSVALSILPSARDGRETAIDLKV